MTEYKRVLSDDKEGFYVAEDTDYAVHFVRDVQKDGKDHPQKLSLFRVTTLIMVAGKLVHEHETHVLAEDDQGAKSQAECTIRLDTVVEHVPLMLRGWSGREF